MADLPPYSTPRWVKIVGIIALVLVLLIGILLLTGVGGEHGPGRHLPAGSPGAQTPPSSLIADRSPSGGLGRHPSPTEHRVRL